MVRLSTTQKNVLITIFERLMKNVHTVKYKIIYNNTKSLLT